MHFDNNTSCLSTIPNNYMFTAISGVHSRNKMYLLVLMEESLF